MLLVLRPIRPCQSNRSRTKCCKMKRTIANWNLESCCRPCCCRVDANAPDCDDVVTACTASFGVDVDHSFGGGDPDCWRWRRAPYYHPVHSDSCWMSTSSGSSLIASSAQATWRFYITNEWMNQWMNDARGFMNHITGNYINWHHQKQLPAVLHNDNKHYLFFISKTKIPKMFDNLLLLSAV